MNIYHTTFYATCPSDGERIQYDLTLTTRSMVMAEDIRATVEKIRRGYQEQIAEKLLRSFDGCNLTLQAVHRGVHITSVLPDVAAA